MSEVMLEGVLKMPYEMAMANDLSRQQYYSRAQEALRKIEEFEKVCDTAYVVVGELLSACGLFGTDVGDRILDMFLNRQDDETLIPTEIPFIAQGIFEKLGLSVVYNGIDVSHMIDKPDFIQELETRGLNTVEDGLYLHINVIAGQEAIDLLKAIRALVEK
jgi:hypothetical protein